MNYFSEHSREYFEQSVATERKNRVRAYLRHNPVLELIEALGAWNDPELMRLYAAFEVLDEQRHHGRLEREDYATMDYLRQQIARTDAPMPAMRRWWAETQEMVGYE